MKIDVHNQEGKKTGQVVLPKEIFEVALSPDLVHQVMVCQMSNRRQGTAHAKDRSEVRGGGRKPWRQKGTGRARHGSTRSPIWIGGGVTFGPRKERNYKKQVPRKIRRKALFMTLSAKTKENMLLVLDEIKLEEGKTKSMAQVIKNLRANVKKLGSGSILIALPDKNENVIRASKNIPKVTTIQAKDLNTLDMLNYKYLLLPKKSIKVIKETFSEKESKS